MFVITSPRVASHVLRLVVFPRARSIEEEEKGAKDSKERKYWFEYQRYEAAVTAILVTCVKCGVAVINFELDGVDSSLLAACTAGRLSL